MWVLFMKVPAILLALTVHEYAHARVSAALGDPTARLRGRLTLNPLSHLDPMGFVCLLLAGFGWAKPVPINPLFFSNPRKGMMWSSCAGPVANFLAAIACSVAIRLLQPGQGILSQLLALGLFYNVTLAIFNLLPFPPLDGSHVLKGLLPSKAAMTLHRYDRPLMFTLFGIILADSLLHTRIMATLLMGPTMEIFVQLGGREALMGLMMAFRGG